MRPVVVLTLVKWSPSPSGGGLASGTTFFSAWVDEVLDATLSPSQMRFMMSNDGEIGCFSIFDRFEIETRSPR